MQRRRSIFLINKRFQIRFSIYVCGLLAILCVVYPVIVYDLFDYFMRYAAMDPLGPSMRLIKETRKEVLGLLLFGQLLFLVLTFLISVFISHRIAGPIYKLRQFLEKARTGNLKQDLHFRKWDHFPELAEDYNKMMFEIRSLLEKNVENVSRVIIKVEKAVGTTSGEANQELTDALATLREIQKHHSSLIF